MISIGMGLPGQGEICDMIIEGVHDNIYKVICLCTVSKQIK